MTQWSNQRLHVSCGSPVSYATVSAGYDCACLECDEDLWLVETYVKPLQATDEEWADIVNSIMDKQEESK